MTALGCHAHCFQHVTAAVCQHQSDPWGESKLWAAAAAAAAGGCLGAQLALHDKLLSCQHC